MGGKEVRHNLISQIGRGIFRFDAPVLIFLLVSWLLIFAMATLALERDTQQWLPISLVPEVLADYGIDQNVLKSAPVDPEIIEEQKRDALAEANPIPVRIALSPEASPTPEVTPTPTATPRPGRLTVSAGGPYEGVEGSPIALTAGGFNAALNILPETVTYRWDLNQDGAYDDAEGISTSVIFRDEGEYVVGVQATDLLGRVATDVALVTVRNAPPIVSIEENWYANEAQEITFMADAHDPGDDILFFEWHFGDGDIVSGTSRPSHAYKDDGEYTVLLRVRDNDNGLTEALVTAHIENLPPNVNAGQDKVVDEGSSVTFQGQASDPAGSADDLTLAWDFNYNGQTFSPDADGPTASTIYADGPAKIVAALLARDDDGGQTIDTVNVTVNNVAPTIVSVSNNGPVGEGSELTLTVNATDVGNDILTYAYDWDNDGTFEAENQSASVTHVWPNQGDYKVSIRVDDGDGGQDFITTTVTAFNLPPIAVAQGPPTAKFEGDSVVFSGADSSDPGLNDVLTYLWNFGDGATATGVQPTHVYANNGVYSSTLTVTDDSGDADTSSVAVTILNANPVATINAPTSGTEFVIDEGVNIKLTFGGTATDPGTADILSYAWDLDNDGVFETTGQSVEKTYLQLDGQNPPKSFLVSFRVRDDDYPYPTAGGGQIGEALDTLKITVNNVPPKNATAGGPYSGIEKQPVTLRGSAEDIPDDPLIYEWDFDYADGQPFDVQTTGQTVTNTWDKFGIYSVGLRVRDGDGGQSVVTTKVNINAVPTANAQGPYNGVEGSPITFNGTGTDPDNDPLTFSWNFGDGQSANGATVTHVYADNGTYTAILTVRDSDGASATASTTVTVSNAPPVANAGPDRTANEGVAITLTGSGSDPGTADVLSYAWDFNYDGVTFDVEATTPSAKVTYADGPATVVAALRVKDDDGGVATDTVTITVNNVAPIASAGGPYSGVEGQAVTLTGAAADVPLDTPSLLYTWNFGDGTAGNGQTVSHIWNTGGLYTVTLRVTDKDGGVGLSTTQADINNIPLANAGGPYSGNEGSAIALNQATASDQDGDPLTFNWTVNSPLCAFSNQTILRPTLTCRDNGAYTVTLTVDDGQGGLNSATASVTVNNLPPLANAGGPYSGNEGVALTFDGTGSSDPGPDDALNLTYNWDFGDGATQSGAKVSHAYADNNVYTITLTVTDQDGAANTDITTVTVANVNPTAKAGGPYRTTINVPVQLSGVGTDVPADPLTYTWDFDYDGLNFIIDATGPTVTNTWTTSGKKTVALQVADDDGGSTLSTATVDVGSPPTAVASISPNPGPEGTSLTFNGSGSIDPDNDPLTYTWDFGDGTGANGTTVSHAYADNGNYTVTLTVDDGRGGVDTDTITATITNVNPTADAGANQTVNEGALVNFTGTASDPGSADTLSYAWDFDYDGVTFNVDASGQSASWTYPDGLTPPQSFTVALRVRDDDGGQVIDTLTVTVLNVPPTANAGPDQTVVRGQVVNFNGTATDPGADILTYAWDFDYDGVTFNQEATGQAVTHTWATTGTITVALRVDDGDGGVDIDTVTVVVNSLLPIAWSGSYLLGVKKRITALARRKRSKNESTTTKQT